MDSSFWKACSLVILTVIVSVSIGKTEKEFALILSSMACCAICIAAISYFEPVVALLWEIVGMGNLQDRAMQILLRCVGVATIMELICLLCTDAGSSALGKALQFLGRAVMLSLTIPIFRGLLTLIQEILGEL